MVNEAAQGSVIKVVREIKIRGYQSQGKDCKKLLRAIVF